MFPFVCLSIGLPKASLLFTKFVLNANEHLLRATRPVFNIVQDQFIFNVINRWHVSVDFFLSVQAAAQIKAFRRALLLGLAGAGQRRAGR